MARSSFIVHKYKFESTGVFMRVKEMVDFAAEYFNLLNMKIKAPIYGLRCNTRDSYTHS
jgi:hypothetical protein